MYNLKFLNGTLGPASGTLKFVISFIRNMPFMAYNKPLCSNRGEIQKLALAQKMIFIFENSVGNPHVSENKQTKWGNC